MGGVNKGKDNRGEVQNNKDMSKTRLRSFGGFSFLINCSLDASLRKTFQFLLPLTAVQGLKSVLI